VPGFDEIWQLLLIGVFAAPVGLASFHRGKELRVMSICGCVVRLLDASRRQQKGNPMSATLTGRAVDAEALFGAIDRFDAEAFNGFFASGASYTVSNYPPYVGRDEIATAAAAWWASVNSLRHDILEVFPFPGGFVSRLEVTYGLKDGREVTLPVAAITHTAAEKTTQHRLYLNDSPLAV